MNVLREYPYGTVEMDDTKLVSSIEYKKNNVVCTYEHTEPLFPIIVKDKEGNERCIGYAEKGFEGEFYLDFEDIKSIFADNIILLITKDAGLVKLDRADITCKSGGTTSDSPVLLIFGSGDFYTTRATISINTISDTVVSDKIQTIKFNTALLMDKAAKLAIYGVDYGEIDISEIWLGMHSVLSITSKHVSATIKHMEIGTGSVLDYNIHANIIEPYGNIKVESYSRLNITEKYGNKFPISLRSIGNRCEKYNIAGDRADATMTYDTIPLYSFNGETEHRSIAIYKQSISIHGENIKDTYTALIADDIGNLVDLGCYYRAMEQLRDNLDDKDESNDVAKRVLDHNIQVLSIYYGFLENYFEIFKARLGEPYL